jgi:hypothetical protein
MDDINVQAAQLLRQLATLKVLNKLSNQFCKTEVQGGSAVGMDGFTLVHLSQLKQAMGYRGSDEDFVIRYHNAMVLLRRHEMVNFGTIRLAQRSFYDRNDKYNVWFFNIVDRACELVRQIPDDARLMQCVDLFRTLPGPR